MGELKRGKEKISAARRKNIPEQLQKDEHTIKSRNCAQFAKREKEKVGRSIFDQSEKAKTQFERIKLSFPSEKEKKKDLSETLRTINLLTSFQKDKQRF